MKGYINGSILKVDGGWTLFERRIMKGRGSSPKNHSRSNGSRSGRSLRLFVALVRLVSGQTFPLTNSLKQQKLYRGLRRSWVRSSDLHFLMPWRTAAGKRTRGTMRTETLCCLCNANSPRSFYAMKAR